MVNVYQIIKNSFLDLYYNRARLYIWMTVRVLVGPYCRFLCVKCLLVSLSVLYTLLYFLFNKM